MINSLIKTAAFYKNSYNDFSTKRKLVVIESDDWGSIRMPNKKIYDNLINNGFNLANRPFERFDSIATDEDLTLLFETLLRFKDFKGNNPIITANVITGNPDFKKIREDDFQNFHIENFTQTLKNYDTHFTVWKEGISNKVFYPQFHGREHLNVTKWMNDLNDRKGDTFKAFEYELMGIPKKINPEAGNIFQTAFDIDTEIHQNKIFLQKSIKHGIEIFEKTFKYKPLSFIAPVYTWDSFIESILKENHIKFVQGGRFQLLPNKKGRIKHYLGERKNEMTFNVRNAYFEPSTNLNYKRREDNLVQLKNQTILAFRFNKPLVISMHRLNFVGRIEKKNRDVNLELLKNYFSWLLNKYPKVEFLNTVELLKIIENENSHT